MKDRADKRVVSLGLADSRQKAQALIMAGLVYAGGQKVEKAGQLLDTSIELSLKETLPFVGRGGLKLAEALDVFELDVAGKTAVDLGSSTGGFTDCLLQRGAAKVFAVDVDTRQLDVSLREDPRVVLIEKNARFLGAEDIPETVDLVTLDLSFISVLKVLPAIKTFGGDAFLVSLIKPQFEVGRGQVGKKGIVKDKILHEEVLRRIAAGGEEIGFLPLDVVRPSVRGQKGNQEYFILWAGAAKARRDGPFKAISDIITEAVWDESN